MLDYDKIYTNHECKICGRFCKNRRSLGNHLTRSHNKLKMREYILEYFLDGKVPLCACGCGQEVNWHKLHYRFNTYITGHNDTGFDISTYKASPEQIKKRNEAIKKAYKERGEEISEKISKKVSKAYESQEFRDRILEAQNEGRAKPGVMKRIAAIRQKVWDEQGDEIREKRQNKRASTNQQDIKIQIQDFLQGSPYKLIEEKENKQATTIVLSNDRKYVADFYIEGLDLYIEFSGCNYLNKLLKMVRAHRSGVRYFAILDIKDSELGVPSVESQLNLLSFLIRNELLDKITKESERTLWSLLLRFGQLCEAEFDGEEFEEDDC